MIVMKQTKNEMFSLTSPSIPFFFGKKKEPKQLQKTKDENRVLFFFKQSKLPVKIFTFDPEGQQKFLHPAAKQNNTRFHSKKKKKKKKKKDTP